MEDVVDKYDEYFKNGFVLVTGGIRGIGCSISTMLQARGFKVLANYLVEVDEAKAFVQKTKIPALQWDVSNFSECDKNIKMIEEKYGSIAFVVNNAGITDDSMLHKMEQKQWQRVIDTNLGSCFNICRAIVPNMRTRNFGRIVNISSINGLRGQLGQTNYSASKAGILAFTRSLALENAIKGITVNAVAPGYTNTSMVRSMKPEIVESIVKNIPLGRLAEPEEIAEAVAYLFSKNAAFVTGATLSVNGGQDMSS